MLKRHHVWHLSIHDVDPTKVIFHLSLYHRIGLCWQQEQASAARMPRSREILNKGGESRRWKIPAGPILRLHMPSSTLTAGWLLASQPVCPLSPQPEHTPTHTQTHRQTQNTHTHMQHMLHWGQASKSNPGLLFCPERTAAPSTHTTTTEEGKEVQEGWMKNERRWRGS